MISHDVIVLVLQVVIMIMQAILAFINQHQTELLKVLKRNQQENMKERDL